MVSGAKFDKLQALDGLIFTERDVSKFYSLLGVVIFIGWILGCGKTEPLPLQHVKLGIANQPTGILMYVALNQKLFEKYGLDVEVKTYPSGRRALDEGLFTQQVDVVTTTEMPVAFSASTHSELRIVASLSSSNDINRICARRDLGVYHVADLKNKTIAVQLNSASHYFLSQFLKVQGIDEKQVTLVDMKVEELVNALKAEKIAAFSSREPYISSCQMQLGEKSIVFAMNQLYEQRELLMTTHKFSDENPAVLSALLKVLIEAERYIKSRPKEEIVALASAELDIPFVPLMSIFEQTLIRVELPHALLLSLEDEFRWQGKGYTTQEAKMPNFNNLFLVKPLKSIAPKRVTIIE